MTKDPFIRKKFTKESSTARKAEREYFKRYPKEQFLTEIETCYETAKAEHEAKEVAGRDGSVDSGRDAGRPDNACAHRRHEGIEPWPRSGV